MAAILAGAWGLLVWANWWRFGYAEPGTDWLGHLRQAVELLPHVPPGAALAAAAGHAGRLARLGLLAAAALGAGAPALRWLGSRPHPRRRLEAAALGAAAGGTAMLALALLGLARPSVAWLPAVAAAAASAAGLRAAVRSGLDAVCELASPPARPWSLLLLLAVLSALPGALAPETSVDAQLFHLALPAWVAGAGRWTAIPWNEFALHPALGHAQMLWGVLLGGPALGKLVSFGWTLLGGTVVWAWTRERAGASWATAAAAGYLLLPYVHLLAMRAYPDPATAAYAALLLRGLDRRGANPAVLGVFAGACAATKLTGLLAPALVAGALAATRAPARAWMGYAAAGAALLLPWAVRNWAWSGNPAAPLLPGLIPTLGWDPAGMARHLADLANAQREPAAPGGALSVLARPWNACVRGYGVLDPQSGAGAWFLWLLPLLAAFPRAAGRRLPGLLLGGFVLWNLMPRLVRYSMPLWPAGAVAAACALRDLLAASSPLARRPLLAAASALLWFHWPLAVARQHDVANPVPVALGAESPDRYLARGLPEGPRAVAARDWLRARAGEGRTLLLTPIGLWLFYGPATIVPTLFDTPLPVRFARACPNAGRIAIRFRQLGLGRTLSYPLSGYSLQWTYGTWAFDAEAAARWRSFWESRAELVHAEGDRIVVHRLRLGADPGPPPATGGFLPGLDEQWLAPLALAESRAPRGSPAETEVLAGYERVARETGAAAAWEHLAAARLSRGMGDGAREAFREARRRGRRTVATLAGLGMLEAQRGRWREAEAALADALAVDPTRGDVAALLRRVRAEAAAP